MIDDREVRNGHIYESVETAVILTVYTKSPKKWLLLDRETGQSYEGNEGGHWDKLIPKEKHDGV